MTKTTSHELLILNQFTTMVKLPTAPQDTFLWFCKFTPSNFPCESRCNQCNRYIMCKTTLFFLKMRHFFPSRMIGYNYRCNTASKMYMSCSVVERNILALSSLLVCEVIHYNGKSNNKAFMHKVLHFFFTYINKLYFCRQQFLEYIIFQIKMET